MSVRQDKAISQEEIKERKEANAAMEAAYNSEDDLSENYEIGADSIVDIIEDSIIEDKKPAKEEIIVVADEWAGLPESLKIKFQEMEAKVSKAEQVASTASGRAAKLQSEMSKNRAPPVKAVPTSQQLQAAMGSQAKLDALKEDWPDLAEAIGEMKSSVNTAVGGQMDKMRSEIIKEMRAYNAEAIEDASVITKLDNKHPGWQNTSATQEFRDWVYKGGPSQQEILGYENRLYQARASKESAPEQSAALFGQADAYYNQLLNLYPVWADDKGSLFGDSSGLSALKLLDKHKALSATPEVVIDNKDKQKKRLESNLSPTSGNGARKQQDTNADKDAEAAMMEAYYGKKQ